MLSLQKETDTNSINRMRLRALIIVIGVAMLLPAIATAQTEYYEYSDSLGTYVVKFKPHKNTQAAAQKERPARPNYTDYQELRLGIAWNPFTPNGYAPNFVSWYRHPIETPIGTELNRERWFTVNADYGGYVKRWLYIGGVASWTTGYRRISDITTHKRVDALNYHATTVMPELRFAWLNRGIVQLYSGIGVGATYAYYDRDYTKNEGAVATSRWGVAFDVTFFGISVGRDWFGYIDLGAGNRGTISAGFGYRFNNK